MRAGTTARAIAVAEELLLVDAATWRSAPVAARVVADGDVLDLGSADPDQLLTATPALADLDDLRAALAAQRRGAAAAAGRHGAALVASGTSLLVDGDARPGAPATTCGCRLVVGAGSPEEAVAVLDRIRPWLPVLLAIAANSPFWRGDDTDYASYRAQLRGRRPAADVRLSPGHAAVQVRVADVALDVDDAVLVAALARALVETAARRWREGRPPPPVRPEVVRLATWRASRSGLASVLVDATTRRPVPARVLVHRLVTHVHEALEEAGDLATVQELAADVLGRGTGAARQRDAYRDRGRLDDVVRLLAERSVPRAPVAALR